MKEVLAIHRICDGFILAGSNPLAVYCEYVDSDK